jgi:hypothetical protein
LNPIPVNEHVRMLIIDSLRRNRSAALLAVQLLGIVLYPLMKTSPSAARSSWPHGEHGSDAVERT